MGEIVSSLLVSREEEKRLNRFLSSLSENFFWNEKKYERAVPREEGRTKRLEMAIERATMEESERKFLIPSLMESPVIGNERIWKSTSPFGVMMDENIDAIKSMMYEETNILLLSIFMKKRERTRKAESTFRSFSIPIASSAERSSKAPLKSNA